MKAKAYTAAGKARSGKFELPGDLFDGTVNEAVLHQVVTAIQANGRQGTHSTKTRNGAVERSCSGRSRGAIGRRYQKA